MTPQKPIRLWPGVVAAGLLVVLRYLVPLVMPDLLLLGMLGGLVSAVAVLVWWLLFSRAPWIERIGAIVLMAAAVAVARSLVHVSIRGGMMGYMLPIFSIFVLPPVFVAAIAISRGRSTGFRRAAIVVGILVACGLFMPLRTAGIKGGSAEWAWRWSPTPEERLLARGEDAAATIPPPPAAPAAPPVVEAPKAAAPAAAPAIARDAEWPGFRGPHRDNVVHGVRINLDWTASPPRELWHRPVGPGWSSFAVDGDRLYTQEQRGEDEVVACYSVKTGQPIWKHADKVRFWESNGGPGPRGTPTLSHGRVYAFGATGLLNALDASTGAVVWSHNVAKDADKEVPMWGFASSPLVVGEVVVVAASGKLAAYDVATGKPRWMGPPQPGSYSSPHRATIGGVEQILLLTGGGAISVAPDDGTLLWEHTWENGGAAIVQPAVTADGEVLINSIAATGGIGIRRLGVSHGENGWNVTERWTSTGLKPYFNDYVVHNGHAYGFDGSILSCIDLANGERKWKGGRYGEGQLLALSDQDVLLVISEDGDLALVSATPDQFKELARLSAIEGKTWNHPVLVGDILLVRNGEEMAAFKISGR